MIVEKDDPGITRFVDEDGRLIVDVSWMLIFLDLGFFDFFILEKKFIIDKKEECSIYYN